MVKKGLKKRFGKNVLKIMFWDFVLDFVLDLVLVPHLLYYSGVLGQCGRGITILGLFLDLKIRGGKAVERRIRISNMNCQLLSPKESGKKPAGVWISLRGFYLHMLSNRHPVCSCHGPRFEQMGQKITG